MREWLKEGGEGRLCRRRWARRGAEEEEAQRGAEGPLEMGTQRRGGGGVAERGGCAAGDGRWGHLASASPWGEGDGWKASFLGGRLMGSGVIAPGYRVWAGGGGERCRWSMVEGGVKTIAERG